MGIKSTFNTDEGPLGENDPRGYLRFALGPLRPAPKEGKGWMFAAGELAMTATDLAKWDISMIDQTVLKPASYREMEREVLLNSGAGSRYGLGVGVSIVNGRRVISHGGEVSGFCAQNAVYPDERAAMVADTLDRFQIVAKRDLYPRQLSGGQQQLVGVARAIISNPKLILADEPTGNLHSSQGEEIMELFKKLNVAGTTIVQVTHSEKNASYGNRVIQLRDGWIVESAKA